MLQSGIELGILSSGISTLLTGCIPIFAILFLTKSLNTSAGIVVSDFRNFFNYNGIKIFSINGIKLITKIELSIEKKIKNFISCFNSINFEGSDYIKDAKN